MAAKLFSVLRLQHRNVRAVELVEPRIGVDVDLLEVDPQAAQGQRRIGNYQGAITAFQAFIDQYPKSILAPRAQYWIGDSYYNLRDFKRSI